MDHVEKEKRPKGIMIWKCHHSFCDGVSSGSLILALSKEFDRSYFLASKDASTFMIMLARILAPFQLPNIARNSMFSVRDSNYFTKKRQDQELSGKLNCSSSYEDIDIQQIKDLSKYKGVTINDVIMCSLTTALKTVFTEQGEQVDSIKMALPANLRFKFYKSRQHVKMENKFAALPICVPLSSTMEESYKRIHNVTKSLKNSMGLVYGTYALSFWGNKLFPRSLVRHTTVSMSDKFTIALSNTPGAIKQFKYLDKETGEVMHNLSSRSYIIIAGHLGMGMCAFSQCGKMCISITSDDTICDREMNKRIVDMTTTNILEEISKMQNEKQKDQSGGVAQKVSAADDNIDSKKNPTLPPETQSESHGTPESKKDK